jgi:hypothetical protein
MPLLQLLAVQEILVPSAAPKEQVHWPGLLLLLLLLLLFEQALQDE